MIQHRLIMRRKKRTLKVKWVCQHDIVIIEQAEQWRSTDGFLLINEQMAQDDPAINSVPLQTPHLQEKLVELQDLVSAIDAWHAHECQQSQRECKEKNRSGSTTDMMLYTFKVQVSHPVPQNLNMANMFMALDLHAGHF